MSKISKEKIHALRDLVNEELFPYFDYVPEKTVITISFKRLDDENRSGFFDVSREYDEEKDGLLPAEIRKAIFESLSKFEPNKELLTKMQELGIEVVFPVTTSKFRSWRSGSGI